MEDLYEIPLLKNPIETSKAVVANIKQFSKDINQLVIWTDGDREGEAIGYDIIDIARAINPRIVVLRAKFSAVTP